MLQVLPSHISNLIAAGEVVQRPASVVKELMENAVDANATNVVVIINDSGRTLIQVIDNGCGMTPQEAQLCFARHATSKIAKAEDLYSISTYGFRGEALASIAACADVTLKTRKEGAESGVEVHVAESEIVSTTEISCPVGCNFAVRNIFYNIPARRKFLKSDNVEYRNIVAEFTKVALTRTDVEFRLVHNSKDIYHLTPVGNIKQRIAQIAGRDIAKDLITTETDTHVVSIRGFVGRPEFAKKNQPNQYLFVNGRYFKSPALHKAILKAYNNLIPDGHTPSYFIFLNIDSSSMDVNIHPSKTEIKFEDEGVIFEILLAAVKEAIGGNSFVPSIDFDTEGAPEIPAISTNWGTDTKRHIAPPKINFDPLFNPFEEEKKNGAASKWNSQSEWNNQSSGEQWKGGSQPGVSDGWDTPLYPGHPPKEYSQGALFNDQGANVNPLLVLKGKYIITTVKSGVMLIDICRAKQRILYERYLDSISGVNVAIQENLYPQTIDLDPASYSVITDNIEFIKSVGFDIRPFGKDCIVVYGTPACLGMEDIPATECVDSLIANLTEIGTNLEEEFKEKFACQLVKSAGIKQDVSIGNVQAQGIIDSLFACKDPNFSPFGEKTMNIISIEELTKKLN